MGYCCYAGRCTEVFPFIDPERFGQRTVNAKADAWLNGISKKTVRVGEAVAKFLEDIKIRTGSEHYIKSNSICENYLLPALRKKDITKVSEQDFQNIINSAAVKGANDQPLSEKSLKNIRSTFTSE